MGSHSKVSFVSGPASLKQSHMLLYLLLVLSSHFCLHLGSPNEKQYFKVSDWSNFIIEDTALVCICLFSRINDSYNVPKCLVKRFCDNS